MNLARPLAIAGLIGFVLAATQAQAENYRAQQIASGWASNCAVDLDTERVDCWGARHLGALGDGLEPPYGGEHYQPVPSPVANLGPVSFLSARSYTACAVETDGTAYCWGGGERGQLGNGSTENSYVPVPVSGGHSFREVVAGKYHSCGVTTDNDVYCWGLNTFGQLGNDSQVDSSIPVAVETNLDAGVQTLALSLWNTCAIDLNDSLFCWGSNAYNIPHGTGGFQSTPNAIAEFSGVTASVALTQVSICVAKHDGTLYCWGGGSQGVLGIGDPGTSIASPPQQVFDPENQATQFFEVTASQFTVCATTATSGAFCWGKNTSGQVGDGSLENRSVPTAIAEPGESMVVVKTGENQTCGLLENGDAYCWGDNVRLQLGNPEFVESESSVPIAVPEPIAPLGVAAALWSLAAVRRARPGPRRGADPAAPA